MKPPTIGQRVRLLEMRDDPDPVPVGTLGTVQWVSDPGVVRALGFMQVGMLWDNGRTLMLSVPPDRFEALHEK